MEHNGLTSTDNAHARSRWLPPVGIWLFALALVPFLGVVWFVVAELDAVDERHQQAVGVSATTEKLLQLTELRVRLIDERNWVSAEAALETFDFAPEFVEAVIGISPPAELAAAQQEIDALIHQLDWFELHDQVDRSRSQQIATIDDLSFDYDVAAAMVEERADEVFDGLLQVAGDIEGGAGLVDALRVVDSAAEARQAIALQLASYFGSQFNGEAAAADLRLLSEQRAVSLDALGEIERIAVTGSSSDTAMAALRASEHVQAFGRAMDELLAAPPTPPTASFDFAAVLADLPAIGATFRSAAGSVDQHLELVEAARLDIGAAVDRIEAAVEDRRQVAFVRLGVLGVASLLFAIGLARAIGLPLRRLAAGARRLQRGDGRAEVRPGGPREVRQAIDALNDAAAHIDLANRQANALARGELASPVLDEAAPGPLGASLQTAVQRLSTSITTRERLARDLHYEATHDSLTGLRNRGAAVDAIRAGVAGLDGRRERLAVGLIDLDGFKSVNDQHGHAAGDRVLMIIAQRLLGAVDDGDMIGRLGGDEFVLVSAAARTEAHAAAKAQRIIDAVSSPIELGSTSVRVGASVGVAFITDPRGVAPEAVLRDADLAVYRAKAGGRGIIEFCDEELRAEQARRVEIEQSLRAALDGDEIELVYRPVVSADDRRLLSLSATPRWHRDGLGAVSAGDVVAVAERSELILEVDDAVIGRAIRQLREWSDHADLAQLAVSVSVSRARVRGAAFAEAVPRLLRSHGVDPARLILEVDERVLDRDAVGPLDVLEQLRAAGVRVAIGNFGAGPASLAELRRLPADIVAFSGAITPEPASIAVTELVIQMGHLLEAVVVAGGVESADQAAVLVQLGADALHGDFFGRPFTVAEVDRAIERLGRADRVLRQLFGRLAATGLEEAGAVIEPLASQVVSGP